ncbi:MAG: penicillin acylase family protein [Flavobacteriales bacterium]|nr:penicillin acylase family protein [Flavobacteriales bacterium]
MITTVLKQLINGLSKRRLPKVEGTLTLKGLKAEVKVVRDEHGVPHIYADNLHDLAFAQGVVHAQDRLFQMELNRSLATGRLAELVGVEAVDTDRAVRTFGFHRIAKKDEEFLDEEIATLLDAYLLGINTYIESGYQKLPIEFSMLRAKPEKWTRNHLLSFSRMMSWQMSFAWQGELARAKLVAKVGSEKAKEIDPRYPIGNPVGLPNGNEMYALNVNGAFEAINGPYLNQVGGSNAWAVSGKLTDTGKPYLCNDPHLPMLMPSIWYEIHLHCPETEVSGVSIPSLPLVLIGHNRHIAWGITLAYTDIQDLFVEEFTSEDTYRFGNEERKATITEEVIHIKGGKAVIEKVVETHHGPIISDVTDYPEKRVALASSCFEAGPLFRGWFEINKATGWNDFVHGVSHLTSPALNIVYADVHENIGYWVTGKVPIRAREKTMLPYNGFTGEDEWKGTVPFEEMPHCLNPASGRVISCNHKIVTDDYPYFLGNAWMSGSRAKRVGELLAEDRPYTKQDMGRFMMDLYSDPGVQFQAYWHDVVGNSAAETQALQTYLQWDGQLSTDTVGGTIYQVLRSKVVELLLLQPLGKELMYDMVGKPFHPLLSGITEMYGHDLNMLMRLLDDEDSLWMKEAGGRKALLQRALTASVQWLQAQLGTYQHQWQWGKLHQLLFEHPVGQKKPFDKVFNVGPLPIGGDTDTVHQTAFFRERGYAGQLVCPSYRQIVDMSDLSQSLNMFAPGNSGQVASKHYNDLSDKWIKGEFKSMSWGMVAGKELRLKG